MRRVARRASLLFALSLGASLGLHAVGYIGLDHVPEVAPRRPAPRSITIDFEVAPSPTEATTSPEAPAVPEVEPPATRTPRPELPPIVEVVVPPPPVPAPPPLPAPTPPTPPTPRTPPPPPPPDDRTAVVQESDDPDVPPPPDARFLADQNRVVEEETVARDRSVTSDEATSAPPPPTASSAPNHVGADDGEERPTRPETRSAEAAVTPPRPATDPPTSGRPPAAAVEPAPAPSGAPRPATPGPAGVESPAAPAAPAPTETVVVDDGFGTFTVERPVAPPTPGTSGGRPGGRPLRLSIGQSGLAAAVGEEALREAREEAAAARARAASSVAEARAERRAQFRFAAENFVGSVRPGNQTALNAARAPYAGWLSTVHRRIHAHFAEDFLVRIDRQGGAMRNPELYAELEFVVDRAGRVLSISIVRTSGVSSFDLGAFSAVLDAQPFPTPPDEIRSGDGHVYVVWGFVRDPMHACHVSQSRPFILPNPPPLRLMPGVELLPEDGASEPSAGQGGPTRSMGPRR